MKVVGQVLRHLHVPSRASHQPLISQLRQILRCSILDILPSSVSLRANDKGGGGHCMDRDISSCLSSIYRAMITSRSYSTTSGTLPGRQSIPGHPTAVLGQGRALQEWSKRVAFGVPVWDRRIRTVHDDFNLSQASNRAMCSVGRFTYKYMNNHCRSRVFKIFVM